MVEINQFTIKEFGYDTIKLDLEELSFKEIEDLLKFIKTLNN